MRQKYGIYDDRKFYDVAKASHACLITGNIRHFPKEPFILTPAGFLKEYLLKYFSFPCD